MKEAIGTSLVFSLVSIFIGVIIVIFVGSIAYTKGFKIRNRIIDRIEEYNGYGTSDDVVTAIENDLKAIGYRIVERSKCNDRKGASSLTDKFNTYNYCVYEYATDRGNYYGVTVFINFDIPLIGEHINIPVYGETRIIYDKGTVMN